MRGLLFAALLLMPAIAFAAEGLNSGLFFSVEGLASHGAAGTATPPSGCIYRLDYSDGCNSMYIGAMVP